MRPLARAAALALALLTAPAANGWGAEGHRIAGLVAEELLDERTRSALEELAEGDSLAEIGLLLDRNRPALAERVPGSERWHYDNRPACDPAAPLARYCADGACASRAYETYLAILADHERPKAQRRFALEVVVHVLEDIHQPLHVADDDDRGANQVRVLVANRRRAESLHAAWDIDFVRAALNGASLREFAHALVAEHRAHGAKLEAGDIASWTRESYALARDYAYGHLPGFVCGERAAETVRLPDDYVAQAALIVHEQLARAGFRLAAVLRAAL